MKCVEISILIIQLLIFFLNCNRLESCDKSLETVRTSIRFFSYFLTARNNNLILKEKPQTNAITEADIIQHSIFHYLSPGGQAVSDLFFL